VFDGFRQFVRAKAADADIEVATIALFGPVWHRLLLEEPMDDGTTAIRTDWRRSSSAASAGRATDLSRGKRPVHPGPARFTKVSK
jgi:hypothetical protein